MRLVDAYQSFFNERDRILHQIGEAVKNKQYNLEERWELFEFSGVGKIEGWIQHLDSLHDDIVIYDGLVHADRNQTISVFSIVESYEELDSECEYDQKNLREWEKYKFDPNLFKEECMQKLIRGWVYDW